MNELSLGLGKCFGKSLYAGAGLKDLKRSRRLNLYDLSLKPYWGKPDVRNFREGTGNVDYGGPRNPLHIPKGCKSVTICLRLCAPELYSATECSECHMVCLKDARKRNEIGI